MSFINVNKAWNYERKLMESVKQKENDRLTGILSILHSKLISDISLIICDYLNPSKIDKITVYAMEWVHNKNSDSGVYLPIHKQIFQPSKRFIDVVLEVYENATLSLNIRYPEYYYICCASFPYVNLEYGFDAKGLVPGINFPADIALYHLVSEHSIDNEFLVTLIFSSPEPGKIPKHSDLAPTAGELSKTYAISNIVCKEWPRNLCTKKYNIQYLYDRRNKMKMR